VIVGPPLDATVEVWFELAVDVPSAFVAATTARSVSPASAARTVYDCDVAPAMSVHDVELVQRCQ
jgi:hypothetical protein